jgi:hypothetical protein
MELENCPHCGDQLIEFLWCKHCGDITLLDEYQDDQLDRVPPRTVQEYNAIALDFVKGRLGV